jgi:hypothetical protein
VQHAVAQRTSQRKSKFQQFSSTAVELAAKPDNSLDKRRFLDVFIQPFSFNSPPSDRFDA